MMRLPKSTRINNGFGEPFHLVKWDDFIKRHPNQAGHRSHDARIVVDKVLAQKIYDTNTWVNNCPYVADAADVWSLQPDGDCEDKALYKRYLLNKNSSIPLEAMRLTIGVANGQHHAVLVLRTKDGDYVLDNNQVLITPWDKSTLSPFIMWHIGGTDWERLS